jgi:hypothetical protein
MARFSLPDITYELHAIFYWYLDLNLKEIKHLRKLRSEKHPNLYCSPNGWEAGQSGRYSDQSNEVNSPVTGVEWPRGFHEVKVPRFHDNGTGWW